MEELRFTDGDVEVVVLPELGARIHRIKAFGRDLLRTPDDPAVHAREPFFWGAYVMAPWCNRIAADPVVVAGRRVSVESNFPDGTAIHGQVYLRPWTRQDDGSLAIKAGGDGWPWPYEVRLQVEVADATARLELSLVNRSDQPMPAGLGLHPWFRRPIEVAIRADRVYTPNSATPPEPDPVGGPYDLRDVGPMANDLDATWLDLAEPPVEIRWPEPGISATMRIDSPTRYVVAASPSDVDAIAVEPQTHVPQGLRRLQNGEPGGLTMLDPGQTLRLRVDLAFEELRA